MPGGYHHAACALGGGGGGGVGGKGGRRKIPKKRCVWLRKWSSKGMNKVWRDVTKYDQVWSV